MKKTCVMMVLGVLPLACNAPTGDFRGAMTKSASAEEKKSVTISRPKVVRRRETALRQADELRIPLIVLPGDALVEVDGQRVERRDGVVDLVGKIGDVRRIRVWKGEKNTGDRLVTIAEGNPSPSVVDLDAPLQSDSVAASAKKPKVVEFGFDE